MNFARVMALTLVLVLGAQISCTDVAAPAVPVPGELTVHLETPNSGDGAILLRVSGPQATAVTSASASYVLHTRSGATDFMSAVFGSLTDGPLLRFHVPDVNRSGDYAVTVVEVGDATNALRGSLTGYRVTIVKP